jgi:heme/copper-type cytochrome/quinol oxidase subunit 1
MVIMGTAPLTFTGFIYYLFPLITGKMYNERAAKVHFILAFVGVMLVFGIQHLAKSAVAVIMINQLKSTNTQIKGKT